MMYKLTKNVTGLITYLLYESGEEGRTYTKLAAADGVLTYSYNDNSLRWAEPNSNLPWEEPTMSPSVADDKKSRWVD